MYPEGPMRSLPPPPEGDSQYLKERAKIRKLLEKHQIQLDEETTAIVDEIVTKGSYARGLDKILTKEWFINTALQLYHAKFNTNRQRTLEWLAELTGVYVRDPRREASTVADVVLEELNAPK